MTDSFTPVMRALVVVTLLMASATVMLVAVSRARAAGALAIGTCGAYGEAYDYHSAKEASDSAQSKCQGKACRVVATIKRGCAAFAVDLVNPCGATVGQGGRIGRRPERCLALVLPRRRQGVRHPHILLRRQGVGVSPSP